MFDDTGSVGSPWAWAPPARCSLRAPHPAPAGARDGRGVENGSGTAAGGEKTTFLGDFWEIF